MTTANESARPGTREEERYRTIVADPPWRYGKPLIPARNGSGRITDKVRGAEEFYETMTPEAIRDLPVQQWASDSAHLYLWITNLKLAEARPFDIIEAWGFRYVTMLTWHKLAGGKPGLGYYFRGETEHVLFAVRGKAPIAPAVRESNLFAARKGAHSVKPDRFYEMVERVSPGPYLELFARRRRYGWDVWGDEAPEFAASQAEMGLSA